MALNPLVMIGLMMGNPMLALLGSMKRRGGVRRRGRVRSRRKAQTVNVNVRRRRR